MLSELGIHRRLVFLVSAGKLQRRWLKIHLTVDIHRPPFRPSRCSLRFSFGELSVFAQSYSLQPSYSIVSTAAFHGPSFILPVLWPLSIAPRRRGNVWHIDMAFDATIQ